MKLLVLSTLLLSVGSTSNQEPLRDGRSIDEPKRRDGVSYSTNVVHIDPKYPDQQALSSIDFKSGTSDLQLTQESYQPTNEHIFQYTTPKSIQDYSQSNYRNTAKSVPTYETQKPYSEPESQVHSVQDYEPQREIHKQQYESQPQEQYHHQASPSSSLQNHHIVHHQNHQIQHSTPTKYVHKPQSGVSTYPSTQSQSFNVGYSVKFMNGAGANQQNQRSKSYKAPRLETDIITGSHIDVVSKPNHYQPEQINHNVFLDTKKQKLSGIKPKYGKANAPVSNTKHIIAQANFTPETQKHLAYLDAAPSTNKFQKELEQKTLASIQSFSSPWQNLSPSVEIYRSKELDISPSQSRDNFAVSNNGFDHQKALGKSVGFDYTNAVDFSNIQNSQLQTFAQQTANIYEKQPNQFGAQPEALNLFSPTTSDNKFNDKVSLPKLPIDTSLLRDPVITMNKKQIDANSKTIPIHFDTTLIQEMGKQYGHMYEGLENGPRIAQQSYDTNSPQQGFSQSQPIQGGFENHFSTNKPQEINHQLNLQQFNHLLGEQSRNNVQKVEAQTQFKQYAVPHDHKKEQLGIFLQKPKSYENKQKDQGDIKFGYPQNGLFNPSLHKNIGGIQAETNYRLQKKYEHKPVQYNQQNPKMYMVNENTQEVNEPKQQTQFKVFGKPQNNFMRHEFEKYQKVNTNQVRYPRVNPKRIMMRDFNIHTGLIPPPRSLRIRRMFMG